MASLLDFLPLFRETAETIRSRMDADINAGIDPQSDDYVDTTEGGFYWDLTQVVVLEIERLMDMLATEVPAAAFPQYAWGDYLDDHAETLGLERKDASKSTGSVTFTGTNDTIIPQGTRVATPQGSPEDDPIEFVTTETVTIAAGSATAAIEADEAGSRFNVAIGTLTVLVNAPDGVDAASNADATTGGADVESDEAFRERILLELSSPQGAGNAADYERWALAYEGVGYATVEPLWDGPGTVRVLVTDPSNDPVSSTVTAGLKNQLDPASASTTLDGAVTLPEGTITVASTVGFREATELNPQKIFVDNQPVEYTGRTSTEFTGCTGGSGLIADGATVSQSGVGTGLAPIGATVWVDTPSTVVVNVAADVSYESGYSDGSLLGAIDVSGDIEKAIDTYFASLGPGDDVIHAKVVAAIVDVEGVADVSLSSVELNGSATNATIEGNEVSSVGTITLT